MTTYTDSFFAKMRARGDAGALWWRGREYTARELLDRAEAWKPRLAANGIGAGTICGYRGEYSPETVALMLALLEMRAILVPFTRQVDNEIAGLLELAEVEALIDIAEDDTSSIRPLARHATVTPLLQGLRDAGRAGLVVFSSGSTGKPKGIAHDFERVLRKFEKPRNGYRTLMFLLLDHFGGVNTLFGAFANGGVVVVAGERTPSAVARLVADAKVELLPVTPTFLNLLIASGAHLTHDLSSVKLITYGTEVMPEATLRKVVEAFPNARTQQTYGLSEVGVLRSSSRGSDSLWVKVGGEGFETRIVDGQLHVRSDFAMLGYLNAPSPFDAEGWMNTQDQVEVDGEWVKILGRVTDMINVGGQKVFPAEVESVLLTAPNVAEAAVYGEKHPLMGRVVVARVTLDAPEDPAALRQRLRAHCLQKLAGFKVPVRFVVTTDAQHSERFKKVRGPNG